MKFDYTKNYYKKFFRSKIIWEEKNRLNINSIWAQSYYDHRTFFAFDVLSAPAIVLSCVMM